MTQAVVLNAINIEKLELFLTEFVDLVITRQKEHPEIELRCDILKTSINETSECGTPGCHAGWIHIVMTSFCEEYQQWNNGAYYSYDIVGDWFICWLFDRNYNEDESIDVLKYGFSEKLWGNPMACKMFCMQESFDKKSHIFPVSLLIGKWEEVLRKLKYKQAMIDLIVESGYISSETKINNDDFVYGHWHTAKKIWEMMDASNPIAVHREMVRLVEKYKQNDLTIDVFKHPLVLISIDKFNQLLDINGGYNNTKLTKAYDIAHRMYKLTTISPYGPVQPVL